MVEQDELSLTLLRFGGVRVGPDDDVNWVRAAVDPPSVENLGGKEMDHCAHVPFCAALENRVHAEGGR